MGWSQKGGVLGSLHDRRVSSRNGVGSGVLVACWLHTLFEHNYTAMEIRPGVIHAEKDENKNID
jgi:hypothetical protein